MRRAATLLSILLIAAACGEERKAKPLSEPGEKLYDVRGKILSRDAAANTINTDHEAISGFMEAMIMDYTVRGADVGTLPPDGARFQAKLHVTERGYWLTDVRAIPN